MLIAMLAPAGAVFAAGGASFDAAPRWVAGHGDGFTARLAVREVRRYLYVTGGPWVPLKPTVPTGASGGAGVLVVRLDDPRTDRLLGRAETARLRKEAVPGGTILRTIDRDRRRILLITAADDVGLLRGA